MSAANVCPSCQHENEADASYCVKCGTLLVSDSASITTVPVSQADVGEATARRPTSPLLYEDTLALFVIGESRPILLQGADRVVLGRQHTSDGPRAVDLSPYHAQGVSRQHALISAHQDGYTIKDLGSTNGTWLNGILLLTQVPYRLRSGDQLRLGNLTLYVYFNVNSGAQ